MQLTSEANNQDLTSLINHLCDTDATSYPLAQKVLNINSSLEELVGEIINSDGTWEFDDTNYTDLPRATGNLVEGQQTYSFSSDYLQIIMIEIKDVDGKWRKIKPIDQADLGDYSPDEFFGQDSSGNPQTGFPWYFDQQSDTIYLYYAPTSTNVTLTSGIRVSFKRTVDLFTTSDTTQEPGLPSTHHSLLAYMASLPYCIKYHPERVALYQKKVDEMRRSLISHYARREKARKKIMTMKPISFR